MPSPAVGWPTPLRDGPEKLTGRARYGPDVVLPGMLRLRLVSSPYAHARIRSVDRRAALAHPGVVAVLTADDLPTLDAAPGSRSQAMLAKGRVVFQGQPVALVTAADEAAAHDGATLVAVEYDPLPPLLDPREAMRPDAPPVWPGRTAPHDNHAGAHGGDASGEAPGPRLASPNAGAAIRYRRGDVDWAFRESDIVLEREYRSAMVHQAYLEPHATAAAYDVLTGELTIWTSTQGQFFVRAEVARALRIPERRVRVVPTTVGGAFGGKFALFEPLVAAAAVQLRRAVSLVATRVEEFQAATPAPAGIFTIKMGARRDGTLTALQAEILFDSGAFGGSPVVLAALATGAPYRIPHLDIQSSEALTNKAPAGSYRAPGATPAVFAVESHVDDLARALAIDPIEFRLRNLIDGDPMHDGSAWPPLALRACLETLRDHPVWRSRGREPGRGCGVALTPWRGGLEPAAAVCRLDEDGTLNVMVGSIDITGSHTSLVLMAADLFGVPEAMVRIQESDTAHAPYAGLSAGSKTTYTVGLAVRQAVAEAKAQLLEIAADVMEASAGDLDVAGGWVAVRGVPDRRMFVGDVARLTMQYNGRYAPVYGRGTAAASRRAAAAAAHLAEVRVDPDTGAVTVERYVAVHDVGRAINPPAVRGQIQGGVAQGIGWALFEQMVYDEQGTLVTASFADYALPSFRTVPRIDVRLLETPLDFTPFGLRGVGEPPVVPVAAAIANAVCDATGARVSALPITPADVLAARHSDNKIQRKYPAC